MQYFYKIYKSPIGQIYLVSDGASLRALTFSSNWKLFKDKFPGLMLADSSLFRLVFKQLDQYFAGRRKQFSIPYVLNGTEFQESTWRSLLKISYGSTCSYSEQAKMIKRPKAMRAVGTANSKNPLCIIVPCHRVTRAGDKLGGYAGGLFRKQFLLKLEASNRETADRSYVDLNSWNK